MIIENEPKIISEEAKIEIEAPPSPPITLTLEEKKAQVFAIYILKY